MHWFTTSDQLGQDFPRKREVTTTSAVQAPPPQQKDRDGRYTAEKKVANLRRHLLQKVAVSDLCDEYCRNVNVLHCW